ncbi:GDSL esterase/lipase At5g55050-like [Oryza brachyantha]|uniref:GDSL esterase/lipase At5g55050-like n=1 Tax=Oryza brachyantha TaxID=4533 RepID=UPI0003EAA0FA|nr:GDSL esterase/lipase At5g55050-like [Oryza brachyantha]
MAGQTLPVIALVAMAVCATVAEAAAAKVPAMYVFGDSTADVGNNNYLPGAAVPRANFPHNGIDFPTSRPTGRFSNGYNGVDFLALNMGFRRSPPPYLAVANKTSNPLFRGLQGVNFASAGSGILDSTGQSIIPMSKQVEQFAIVQRNISSRISKQAADSVLSRSLFLISTGGNDIFAFFSRNSTPSAAEMQQFVSNLVSLYTNHVKDLYVLGARKFAVIDVPPIGCCPYPRSMHPLGACIDVLNELARGLNKGVKDAMHGLSVSFGGLKYSIGSSHAVVQSIMKHPQRLGFKEVTTACCGSGKFNGKSGCTPNATLCNNRHDYLFWDLLHPTHATSKLAAAAIYNGTLRFAAPVNFRQLVDDHY